MIGLLSRCMGGGDFTAPEAVAAYRLLALSYLITDDAYEAKLALVRVLGINPGYEPDPRHDPPAYGVLVDEVKRELRLPSAAAFRCDRELMEAEEAYQGGAYDDVVTTLRGCLDKPELDGEEAVRAYRMLALTHLSAGSLGDAREAILSLLGIAPRYEADPVRDLPVYASLVSIVKGQLSGDLTP